MGTPIKLAAAAALAAFAIGAGAATMSPKAAAVVMDQGSRLPAGYTQLEYIEVAALGGFDLGVQADFQSRIEAKILLGHAHNDHNVNLWGSRISTTKGLFVFGVRNGHGFGYEFSTNRQVVATTYEIDKPYLVDLDYKALTYSIVLDSDMNTGFTGKITPPGDGDGAAPWNMRLFSYSINGESNSYQWRAEPGARIYYFRYYYGNGAAAADIVPARRDSDGAIGIFDLVSKTFKVNAVSGGAFTGGPALKVVDGDTALTTAVQVDDIYVKDGATLDLAGTTLAVSNNIYIAFDSGAFERVDYIHVDSNVVFKTGYKTQADDQAQIDIMFGNDDDTIKSGGMVPFFSRTTKSKNLLSMWHWRANSTSKTKNMLRFDYDSSGNDYAAVPDPKVAADKLYRFTVYSGGATATNLTDGTALTLNNTGFAEGEAKDAYMWLLGGMKDGNTSTNEGTDDYDYFCTNTKFYDFQVSNGGEVKCHFVPVKRQSDGAIGIFDIAGDLGFVKPTIVGSGKATAATEAKTEQYKRLDHLHVDTNVVFKTGYRTMAGDRAQIDVMFDPSSDANKTRSMVPFFSRTATSENCLSMWYWRSNSTSGDKQNKLRFDYAASGNSYAAIPSPEIVADKLYRFSVYSGGATATNLTDGTALTLNNTGFAEGEAKGAYMWLLGGTEGNTASNEGTGKLEYFCTGTKFYDFQVSNGVVQCHFVPVKRASDGKVGIYDIEGDLGFVEASGTGTPTAGEETGETITQEIGAGAPEIIRKVRFVPAAEADGGITLKGGAEPQSTLVLTPKNGTIDLTNVALSGNIRLAPAVAEGAAAPALANARIIPDGTGCAAVSGIDPSSAMTIDFSEIDFGTRRDAIPVLTSDDMTALAAALEAGRIAAEGLPTRWKLAVSRDGSRIEAARNPATTIYIR